MATPQEHKGILLEVGTNEVEFLRFGLGEQTFGINVTKIRQVMVYRPEDYRRDTRNTGDDPWSVLLSGGTLSR